MGYINGPINTLTDYQVEYDGFLMGAGTSFGLPPVWEWLDMPAVKTMDEARDWADGSYSGTDYADVITPSVDVEITGTGTAASFIANVVAFRNNFTIGPASPLWVKLPNMALFGIAARVHKRILPIGNTFESGLSVASLQFRMTDPIWQSMTRSTTLSSSGSAVAGMVFPLFNRATGTYTSPGTLDFGSTATSSSGAVLTNVGNADSWPYVVVTGPISGGFTVILAGQTVTYADDVQSGSSVIIDYKSGTAQLVTSGGPVDRTYVLSARNFVPVPGAGSASLQFIFAAASGSAVVSNADMWR